MKERRATVWAVLLAALAIGLVVFGIYRNGMTLPVPETTTSPYDAPKPTTAAPTAAPELAMDQVELRQDGAGVWRPYIRGTDDVAVDYTGLIPLGEAWFYVSGGIIDRDFTGLVRNAAGQWYVSNGMVDFGFSGEVAYLDTFITVEEGKVVGTALTAG